MTARVRIGVAGGNSPFRVLGPGADPDNPLLEDIVFDANFGTMRKLQEGRVTVQSKTFLSFAPPSFVVPMPGWVAREIRVNLVQAPPTGQRFYGLCLGRRQGDDVVWAPYQYTFNDNEQFAKGIGMYTTNSRIGLLNYFSNTYSTSSGTTSTRPVVIDYIVLRNVTG